MGIEKLNPVKAIELFWIQSFSSLVFFECFNFVPIKIGDFRKSC